MKYIVIIPDGAADYPLEILGGKTPMEAANTPYMDALAKEGIVGRVKTVPKGFVPSSDVANLSLMGYAPEKYYQGRGPLEAVNLGVNLEDNDVAFRCNLITESEGKVQDYSAGHITDREAGILISALQESLGTAEIKFYPGKSYRHLMVYHNGARLGLDKIKYHAPHDIMGRESRKYFPRGRNSQMISELMARSQEILKGQEINKVRVDLGENPANMIWLWGCGKNPKMPLFKDKFGLEGAVISAVDLIKGIGKLIGLRVMEVAGATGYYDTNYQGKAEAAVKALARSDFVFVHIEATDEAGHSQDLRMKIACFERIDRLVVGTIVRAMEGKEYRILISPDHPTPLQKRTHTDEPVPFLISGSGIEPDEFSVYSEPEAANSSMYFDRGEDLIQYFLKN